MTNRICGHSVSMMTGIINEKRIVEGVFLRDKPAKILLGLRIGDGSSYVTVLSKEANCTYSHTIKILDTLRDLGIVEFEKKGRIKKVTLTETGNEIAKHMEEMIKKFMKLEENAKKNDGKARKSDKKGKK